MTMDQSNRHHDMENAPQNHEEQSQYTGLVVEEGIRCIVLRFSYASDELFIDDSSGRPTRLVLTFVSIDCTFLSFGPMFLNSIPRRHAASRNTRECEQDEE